MRNLDALAKLALVVFLFGSLFAISGYIRPASSPVDKLADGDWTAVAIHGYDPVAYFHDREPVKGSARHSMTWRGTDWWFTSDRNLALFRTDPEKYAPQYGGFSVYGAARGKSYAADPQLFDIIEGRLYLSRNQRVRDLWLQNPGGYIAEADRLWQAGDQPM